MTRGLFWLVGGVQLSEKWGCRTSFCGPLEQGVCK